MSLRTKQLPQHWVAEADPKGWIVAAIVVAAFLLLGAALDRADDRISEQEEAIQALTRANTRMAKAEAARAHLPRFQERDDRTSCDLSDIRDQWKRVVDEQCLALAEVYQLARTLP